MSVIDYTGKSLTQDEIRNRVRELRELVLNDDVLKEFRTYDEYLLRFLYFKDFDVQEAYRVMKEYTNLMLKYSKWYPTTSYIDKMSKEESKAKGFIHGRDRCGRRIYVVEIGKANVNKSSAVEEACSDEIWFESVMDDPVTQANGVCVIIDINELPWKLVQWMTPNAIKTSAAKADLYPCRSLQYHIVNNSPLVNAIVKLVWPFMPETAKKNVMFHFDNWASLHEYVSPEVLPSKYGGTGPDIDFDSLFSELLEHKDEIIQKIAIDQKNLEKLK